MQDNNGSKAKPVAAAIYRCIMVSGLGWLLFFDNRFVLRTEFEEYKRTHTQWGNEIARHHDDKFEQIRIQIRTLDAKIDAKLERLLIRRPQP